MAQRPLRQREAHPGDRHRGPLAEIGGKGAFTRNDDRQLLAALAALATLGAAILVRVTVVVSLPL
ncbi:hypothetical protein [Streptomyces sp. NPDC090022]|uniref:hypothetical protein n=1 Tax=Streptomyces sp. NPDC090022 TaxID=3365920 RepID=UPI00381BC73B